MAQIQENISKKYCECSFPKFTINDGYQSCRFCGLLDHYKGGNIAEWSDDDNEEEEEENDNYCGEPGSLNYLFGLPVKKYVISDDDSINVNNQDDIIITDDGAKVLYNKNTEGWEDVCETCECIWNETGNYFSNKWFCGNCM